MFGNEQRQLTPRVNEKCLPLWGEGDLEVRVCPRPDQRNSRHPIFVIDCFPRVLVFFGREDPGGRGKLWSSNLSPYGAGSDFHLGVIANTFRLSHVTACHYIEPPIIFTEPDGSRNTRTAFTEGGQGNVLLPGNRGGGLACHAPHCMSLLSESGRRSLLRKSGRQCG